MMDLIYWHLCTVCITQRDNLQENEFRLISLQTHVRLYQMKRVLDDGKICDRKSLIHSTNFRAFQVTLSSKITKKLIIILLLFLFNTVNVGSLVSPCKKSVH